MDDLEKVVRQALAELPLGARRQEPGRLTPSQIEPDAAHGEPVVQGETSAVARVRRQPGRPRSSTEMHTIPNRPYGPPDELRAQLPSRSQRPLERPRGAGRWRGSGGMKPDEHVLEEELGAEAIRHAVTGQKHDQRLVVARAQDGG